VSAPLEAAGIPAANATRVSPGLAALALSLLLALQPVTTDVYLPALPLLTRELDAGMHTAQLTMSALILAFGLGQLVWGPVADRIGRRPVLITGLLLYTAASIGSAAAGSIETLVLWRTLQGATMAAAVVCARAIVRDLYEPREGARIMALALSGLGVAAISGPLIGGWASTAWGWRAALSVVAVVGASTLVFVLWRLPETLAVKNPHATQLAGLFTTWRRIARHPRFAAWTLLVSCSYGGLFTLLAGSSFVYIDVLGVSPSLYGALMAVGSVHYLAGTFICRHWVARHGMAGAAQRGAVFTLAGGLIGALLALAGVQTLAVVLMAQCLFLMGHGILQPCGQAGAVGPFPQAAGAASALAGFVLSLAAFGVGLWLGQALDGSVLPLMLGLGFWALLTSTVAWTLVQRSGGR
jgi:MFS transporter, DHA1 family, multidrug resistance protein